VVYNAGRGVRSLEAGRINNVSHGTSQMRMPRCLWLAAAVLLLPSGLAVAQATGPTEIVVVTGRLPGPPLWRVLNGDHVMYIFPSLSPVPEGMIWDSDRVAAVLGQSQEVLFEPDVDADFSTTLMLNPVNLFRGVRLARRLSRNPDDARLESVLPAELYGRYEAIRNRYFPRGRDDETLRPLFAGTQLADRVLREEGLISGDSITRELDRLIRRNRHLVETDIEVVMDLKGSFRDLAERLETLVDSLSPEQERACFAAQLTRLETDLDAMKSRANAWAQGYVDEFRGIPLPGAEDDACVLLIYESSEFETLDALRGELERRWLAEAERALADNASTFAVLDIVELLRENGLLAQLRARGYEVREPR